MASIFNSPEQVQTTIPIGSIVADDAENPRKVLRGIDELAASIKARGLLQPIVVRPVGDGFRVVAGFRRFAALQKLGVDTVPAVVRDVSDHDIDGVVENVMRDDLTSYELALVFAAWKDRGMTPAAIAERYTAEVRKITTPHVRNLLGALAQLCPEAINAWQSQGQAGFGWVTLERLFELKSHDHDEQRAMIDRWTATAKAAEDDDGTVGGDDEGEAAGSRKARRAREKDIYEALEGLKAHRDELPKRVDTFELVQSVLFWALGKSASGRPCKSFPALKVGSVQLFPFVEAPEASDENDGEE